MEFGTSVAPENGGLLPGSWSIPNAGSSPLGSIEVVIMPVYRHRKFITRNKMKKTSKSGLSNRRKIHYASLVFSRASTTVRSPVEPSQRTRRRVSSPGSIPMTVPVRWLSHTLGSRRRTRAPRAKWTGASGVRHAASIGSPAVVTQFEIPCGSDCLSVIASLLSFGVPICENFNSIRTPSSSGISPQPVF